LPLGAQKKRTRNPSYSYKKGPSALADVEWKGIVYSVSIGYTWTGHEVTPQA